MKLLFLTGGFHPELPLYEIASLGVDVIEVNQNLVYGKHDRWRDLKRLGYTHKIFEFLGSFTYDSEELPFDPTDVIEESYAVRTKNICCKKNFGKIKESLEDLVWNNLENPDVDLDYPDISIYFFLLEDKIFCGKLLHEIDSANFTKRKVENRPFFYPISLHPRESRVLVNLSKIKPGEKLLDPFCGTGGILLESSLIGCETYGSDFVEEMVEGSGMNLAYFNTNAEIRTLDVKDLKKKWSDVEPFEAIVTDPPYGTSSKVGGENIKQLYENALSEISKVLVKDGKCVICAPKKIEMKKLIPESLELEEIFEEKVHGSLTRKIFVMSKIN
ncbi:MAG: methyltransferase domain-containing protein [Candidatus Aenigmatarchaeota archaeon]